MALSPESSRPQPAWRPRTWHTLLAALALLAFFIDGYHPWSEDGGLYAASIEHLLDPALFPQRTAFVTAYTHLSVFPAAVACIVRVTHLPLPITLLLLHLASLWLLLYAARSLMRSCRITGPQQLAALSLLAVWSGLPVAGTSLLITDPYLSARSSSTPLGILAISFALRSWSSSRNLAACLTLLAIIAAIHPLAALHAAALVLAVRALRNDNPNLRWRALALILSTLVAAAVIHRLSPPETPQSITAGITRYYWFLSQWHWYELLGLAAPCAILASCLVWQRNAISPQTRTLLRATLLVSALAFATSLLFIHSGDPRQLLDRAQPLRLFLFTYIVMALVIGTTLVSLKNGLRGLVPLLIISVAALAFAQRDTYSHSSAYEWPGAAPRTPNPWQQAFLWIRTHTPPDALFALDADYITMHDEDAQLFRPIAQRSSLVDRSKDGGIVANLPGLAPLWQSDVAAQTDLTKLPDTLRDARLRSLGVTWMVLRSEARTLHPCPYDNLVVKVCTLNMPPY